MDTKMVDMFFDSLKSMRGIAELNKHLLHTLFKMQPGISESTQKFLCLCFSLWDDGNIRVSLDVEKFSELWFKKWKGLKLLKESADGSKVVDFDDFDQIIKAGVDDLCKNCESGFASIVTVLKTNEIQESEFSTPLILTCIAGEKPYLYIDKLFRAKLLIEKYAGNLFKDGSASLPSEDDIKNIRQTVAGIATYEKNEKHLPLDLNDEQAEAVIRGKKENLVITGGPGTGKTTVVLYILWSLLTQKDLKTPNDEMCDYDIYLAAPSGKAADRMQESLQNGLKGIKDEYKLNSKVYEKLSNLEGSTIHRLLKYSRSSNGFSYNAKEQFSEKSIFVIDEASMIDINLFASLLQAVPENARIFVLGDPFQLPSVDAGAVLGEILKPKSKKNFCVKLVKSIRFTDDSVIGNLAKEIKACALDGVAMKEHEFSQHPAIAGATPPKTLPENDVFYNSLPTEKKTRKQQSEILDKFLKYWVGDFENLPQLASEIDPENPCQDNCDTIWKLSLQKRILSAERRGVFGVEQINDSVGKLVKEHAPSELRGKYFPGQLLIITQNQAMYKLYNGDTGIVVYKEFTPYIMLQKQGSGKTGYVFYPLAWFPPDAIESAFAITIHKSQGSEYDHVTMFLPSQEGHPLLNNQIVYTGITRAKKTVTIIATEKNFKAACETVIERDTGIVL